jgi:hypothetical protein
MMAPTWIRAVALRAPAPVAACHRQKPLQDRVRRGDLLAGLAAHLNSRTGPYRLNRL